MKKHYSIKLSHLIFGSFCFILLLFIVTTVLNYRYYDRVRQNASYLVNSSKIVRYGNHFQRNVLRIQRVVKGYLITGDKKFLHDLTAFTNDNALTIDALSSFIRHDTLQLHRLHSIKRNYYNWLGNYVEPQLRKRIGPDAIYKMTPDEYEKLVEQEEVFNDELETVVTDLLDTEYKTREQRQSQLEAGERQTKLISIALAVFFIIISITIAVWVARHANNRISRMVSMANSIAKGDYEVRVPDRRHDELHSLSVSLNDMAFQLKHHIDLLEKKNRELDQFSYMVSHDLKAPLTAVDMLLEFIIADHEQELSADGKRQLQLVRSRLANLQAMIMGILEYAKVGREAAKQEDVDLQQLLPEIIEAIPNTKDVVIEIDPKMPVVRGDRLLFYQIFSNLISNAIKYNDKEAGKVYIGIKNADNRYEFYVRDNGPGIPQSAYEKIFSMFETLNVKSSYESTGVGLSIVKKILEDLGEKIWIESVIAKGSTFIFTWAKHE